MFLEVQFGPETCGLHPRCGVAALDIRFIALSISAHCSIERILNLSERNFG
jgi:hypothetical protein